jgi:radical SAM protein with 4Fe4S-binding SPASM domain
MEFNIAKEAIDYFIMHKDDEFVINFYGGEPLLQYDLMKEIIHYVIKEINEDKSQIIFSLTTNGVLLDHEKLAYLYEHSVDIYLSIDGIKEAHELGRGKNSFQSVENIISLFDDFPEYLPKIKSVITPDNVIYLCDSVRYLLSKNISDLNLNICLDQKWEDNQLQVLRAEYQKAYTYLYDYKTAGGNIQFKEIKKPDPMEPLFKCEAGQDRFAISPDGFIYGCSMHMPWSKKAQELGNMQIFSDLCLGRVNELPSNNFNKKLDGLFADTRFWGQYYYQTSDRKCLDCKYISQCEICPIFALIFNKNKDIIPDWICTIKEIENRMCHE